MNIRYEETNRVFRLDTPNTSYLIGIVDNEQFLGHIYYGKRISDMDMTYLLRISEPPFTPSVLNRERVSFLWSFPFEYPTHGLGDVREACLEVETPGGHHVCGLRYVSHRIYAGKEALPGLPATFGTAEDCTTLEIVCEDPLLQLSVTLVYTAFTNIDAITRSVRIENEGTDPIYLQRMASACLDMDNREYEVMTLSGAWARERQVQRQKIGYGRQNMGSFRGESSHQEHPFLAVLSPETTEESGEVYAMNFVYSGNFLAQVERSQFDSIRMTMGIHPQNFRWKLEKGECFTAPEVVMVYSGEGIGQMTRTFHDLYRNHLIRGEYRDTKRPILINNWEATYFQFDTEKLLEIAREASGLGIEMLVMDDGWFGARNSDNCGLGDWKVNEEKLPGGLSYLVEEIKKLGMKFGIWFEPEMVSPDSDLYRAHPDWAIQVPGRVPSEARQQYVLDMSRKEVRDTVYQMLYEVLKSADISYVKWDMNRILTDLGSAALPADRQGELFHRYVLGVYELQERLITDFPHLLLENCSGGGGRFDAGMLYYSPQIWTSDNTDAIERLKIQRGTAMVYPLSAMGAHVADCPNHTMGRTTPFATRGYVALAGTFGYELDVTKIAPEERAQIPEQVALYHKYNDLIRQGDYYRIASVAETLSYDCYMVVAKDKSEALVTFVQVASRNTFHSLILRLKGLEEEALYEVEIEETGKTEKTKKAFTGDTIINTTCHTGGAFMNAGLLLSGIRGDFQGRLIHLVRK